MIVLSTIIISQTLLLRSGGQHRALCRGQFHFGALTSQPCGKPSCNSSRAALPNRSLYQLTDRRFVCPHNGYTGPNCVTPATLVANVTCCKLAGNISSPTRGMSTHHHQKTPHLFISSFAPTSLPLYLFTHRADCALGPAPPPARKWRVNYYHTYHRKGTGTRKKTHTVHEDYGTCAAFSIRRAFSPYERGCWLPELVWWPPQLPLVCTTAGTPGTANS